MSTQGKHPDQETPVIRSIALSGPERRLVRSGAEADIVRPVDWKNSTVLGYPARRYWPNLLFDHAVPREQSTLMLVIVGPDKAPRDVHLDVPYRHPEDREWRPEELPVYRVRPIWEAGDVLRVKSRRGDRIMLDVADVRVGGGPAEGWQWVIVARESQRRYAP